MNKALIYARVSTDEQAKEGQSIEAQIRLCNNYAKENKITVIESFQDEGKSGSNTNRPALQSMLAKVGEDKTITHILVLDTDRIARNTLDHLSIKAYLAKHGVTLTSISQPMIDDSPEGNFIDVVLAGANALQSQITGRKTAKVMEQKAKAGWWPSPAPLGYINSKNPTPTNSFDPNIVIPDKIKGPLITQLFELYSTGAFTLETLTKKMNDLGMTGNNSQPIGKSTVNRILNSHFYYGQIPWHNTLYPGKHTPLVTKTLFDTCQQIMADHNQHASRKRIHDYLLRGFLFCDNCGSRYWAAPHKGRGVVVEYYFCKSCKKGTYTPVEDLEKQVNHWISKVKMTDEYAHELMEEAKNVLADLRNLHDSEQRTFINQKIALKQKLRQLEDRFLDGQIDSDRFNRMSDRLESQISELEDKESNSLTNYQQKFDGLKNIINMAKDIKKTYKEADKNLKRHYLGLFFAKFLVKDGKIVEAVPSEYIKPLIKQGKISVQVRTNWLPR